MVAPDCRWDEPPADPAVESYRLLVNRLRDQLRQARADIIDMRNASQTVFTRCACGRMREASIVCPTVQEGGTCEAGE